ncbi:transposase, Ptta/En/Spm [Tanacetum coccineum]
MTSRMDNRVSISICNDSQQAEDVLELGLDQSDDGKGMWCVYIVQYRSDKNVLNAIEQEIAEKAKANWAKKKMVQVTAKKSYARVREELKKCSTGNKLTRKELFRACFSKDTGLQKMSKLQMQLMERDDDA